MKFSAFLTMLKVSLKSTFKKNYLVRDVELVYEIKFQEYSESCFESILVVVAQVIEFIAAKKNG